MDLVENLSIVKETLNELSNFNDGFEILDDELYPNYASAYNELQDIIEQKKSLQKKRLLKLIQLIFFKKKMRIFSYL